MTRRQLRELITSDRGSIEAAMVIVPLALLFLTGMQVAVTSHIRNSEKIELQSHASSRAISGKFQSTDRFIHINSSGDGQNLDLLVAHREKTFPILLPALEEILGRMPVVSVDGIAIVENRR